MKISCIILVTMLNYFYKDTSASEKWYSDRPLLLLGTKHPVFSRRLLSTRTLKNKTKHLKPILCLGRRKTLPLALLQRSSVPLPDFQIELEKSNPGLKARSENQSCGVFSDLGITSFRIVGGSEAKLGTWPWIVLLGYKLFNDDTRVKFKCGGALISDKHVVTAAHCIIFQPELSSVRVGELDLMSEHDGAKHKDIRIARKIPHEKYNYDTFENDIGLLILEFTVAFTDTISPVCLPLSPELQRASYEDVSPLIAGWGTVTYGGAVSTKLLELEVPVVPRTICEETYKELGVIDQRNICAGYTAGGKDACQGDSGGPMVWRHNNVYYLVGVISFGYKCAEKGYPGLYTRVASFTDWIQQNMKS